MSIAIYPNTPDPLHGDDKPEFVECNQVYNIYINYIIRLINSNNLVFIINQVNSLDDTEYILEVLHIFYQWLAISASRAEGLTAGGSDSFLSTDRKLGNFVALTFALRDMLVAWGYDLRDESGSEISGGANCTEYKNYQIAPLSIMKILYGIPTGNDGYTRRIRTTFSDFIYSALKRKTSFRNTIIFDDSVEPTS